MDEMNNVEMNTVETEVAETEEMVPVETVQETEEVEENDNGLATIAGIGLVGAAAIYGTVMFGKNVVVPIGSKVIGKAKDVFSKFHKSKDTADTEPVAEADAKEVKTEEVKTEEVETVKS